MFRAWFGTRPHLALAASTALVLALEVARGSQAVGSSAVWPILQALVAGAGLALAWLGRDSLRLWKVALLGLSFQLGWIAAHLAIGVEGDLDPLVVYPTQGQALLDGTFPESEYPPGAVVLFGLETWLGDGAARTSNALLMVPFQLLCVVAIWALRSPWAPWLAAFVALWPLNAYYWEFRFDLVPAAALAVGLALASRNLWYEAGFVLGLGAVVKWTPALAAAALALWLLRSRDVGAAARHVLGFIIPVAAATVPLLLWQSQILTNPYTTQSARTLTGASLWFLPLDLFGSARPGPAYDDPASVSALQNQAAIVAQIVCVVAVIGLALLVRSQPGALAVAALAPAVFLLSNRIFSPQFFVLLTVAIVAATAFVALGRHEVLLVVGALALATTANTVLYQSLRGTGSYWLIASGLTLVPAVLATIWLAARAHARPGLERRRVGRPTLADASAG